MTTKEASESDTFEPLLRNLPGFFDNASLADGDLKCGQKEFKVHRLILSAQSAYFNKAFTGTWKESVEPITLNGDDPCVVEAMLQFMYTFDYDSSGRAENAFSSMVFNVKVYSLADKYDVPALKSQAKQKFETAVATCWDMDDFPDAVAQTYASTPATDRALREVVVNVACTHISQLLMKQRFCDVLGETVGFAFDLVQQLAHTVPKATNYKCPSCQAQWGIVLPANSTLYCPNCNNGRPNWSAFKV